ncbi:branched-chain amino acid ABC transporter substrate-binding protein [Brevibacillus sp. B_LB10_24]|uniref:branched-chain amino acid ABC transporter substrate-binding protein n=1 Tax=Brevibacillus sp. B_LB10_24 TaxID=3380645 RepID=UPI0038B924CD
MKRRKRTSLLAAVVAVCLIAAGCGSSGGGLAGGGGQSAQQTGTASSSSGSAETSAGGAQEAGGGKILIATQTPLSGPQSNVGEAIKLGAELALMKQKEDFKKLGFDLQLFPQDDQGDPKQGVANAEQLVSNPDVLGVVGHYNTGVAIPASVKYEQGNLVVVGPANTGVQLTEEGKKTVHRICARDDLEGPKGAQYAKNQLGVKSAFIIHDKTAYGQGVADEVKAQFEKDGVQILGYEGITPGEKDYSSVINVVVSKNPDMIFFGGLYPEGGILVKQAREKNFKGHFMGSAGLASSELPKIAGAAAEGVVFSSVAGDVTQSDEGKKWAAEYKEKFGKEPESFSIYGYDAMQVVLHGLKEAIDANGGKKPSREQVLEAVHHTTDFQGMFTKVSFDEKGDNKYANIFMYKFENGQQVYIGKAE